MPDFGQIGLWLAVAWFGVVLLSALGALVAVVYNAVTGRPQPGWTRDMDQRRGP